MTYSSTILSDTPLLYWRLDDTSGTAAVDGSGNSRTGTYSGGYTLAQPPLISSDPTSYSVALNGTTGYISTSSYSPFAQGAQRSFELWYNRTNHSTADPLFEDNGANVLLRLASGSQDVSWFADTSTVSANWTAAGPGDGQRVHLVLLFNDSSSSQTYNGGTFPAHTAELYINGVSKGQRACVSQHSTTGFAVGQYSAADFFVGNVDEVAPYAGLLTPARILAHYQAGSQQTVTATDAVTATDTPARTLAAVRAAADSAATSDTATGGGAHPRTATDSVTTSTLATRSMVLARTPVPVVSVGGTPFTTRVSAIRGGDTQRAGMSSYSDVVNIGSASPTIPTSSSLAESVMAADATMSSLSVTIATAEAAATSDMIARTLAAGRTAAEPVATADMVTDALHTATTTSNTVTATVAVGFTVAAYRNTSDTVTTGDTVVRLLALQRTAADTATTVDTATRATVAARTAANTVTAVENVHSVQGVHSPAGVVAPSSQAGRVSPTAVEGEV